MDFAHDPSCQTTMLRQTSRHIRAIQSYRAFGTISVMGYTFMRRVYFPGILQHTSKLRGLTPTSSSSMHTDSNEQYSDLFRYTSGRWLWDEEQKLLDRYRVFDAGELQRVAARSVEANACLDIKKMRGRRLQLEVVRVEFQNSRFFTARTRFPVNPCNCEDPISSGPKTFFLRNLTVFYLSN